jgi:PAS domain S-box-containing protein
MTFRQAVAAARAGGSDQNGSAGLAVRPVQPWARAGRYERRTDAGPDLVSLHAPDGKFLEASPAAFSLLGQAPGGLLGRRWQELAEPSDRQRVANWWSTLRDEAPAQLTFRASSHGEVVWLECTAAVSVANGRVSYVHAVTRDVTHHWEHADELSRRCEELERQNSQLEQANRDLLVLAADAAHDLRAPVQVITGFAELLAGREGGRLDEVSQEFLARILTAAGNMHHLVDVVLEHSHAASAPLELSCFDTNRLVSDVVASLHGQINDRQVRVEVQNLPALWGDRLQLGRVFQNLLSNAVAAVAAGRRPEVVVSAQRLSWQWQLSVTDNGVGVEPDDRTRIFEAFQRGGNSGRAGTGLGLAICKTIVDRHGGRIWVEPVENGGSRFIFTVPAAPARAHFAPMTPAPARNLARPPGLLRMGQRPV